MADIEFHGFPKIARLLREVVITEKIDGTNGAIGIVSDEDIGACAPTYLTTRTGGYHVYAQSRNRIITPGADNHGFAGWVWNNSDTLISDLGPGLHFGEWWGQGIGRKYGLDHKQFSLFNVKRWEGAEFKTAQLDAVPVLSRGLFSTALVAGSLLALRCDGSFAAPGFKNPEGVVVYHTAGNVLFKVTLEDDEAPKSLSVLRRQEAELAA